MSNHDTIASKFPQTFHYSRLPDNELWKKQIDWKDADFLASIDILFDININAHFKESADDGENYAAIIYEELFKCRPAQGATARQGIYTVQLAVTSKVSYSLSGRGRLYDAHNWLLCSLSDIPNIGADGALIWRRLLDLEKSENNHIKWNLPSLIILWIQSLFYYSWTVGGLKKECSDVFPYSYQYASRMFEDKPSEESTRALCHLLSWAQRNDKIEEGKRIATALEAKYISSGDRIKKIIAIQLATTMDDISTKSNGEWADIVLTELNTQLVGHERLQMLGISQRGVSQSIKASLPKIIEEIDTYLGFMRNKNLPIIELKYERTRLFDILKPVIFPLIIESDISTVVTIISKYKGVIENDIYPSKVMMICINDRQGVLYSSEGGKHIVGHDTIREYPAIVDICNKFLGQTVTFNDGPAFEYSVPERPGTPEESLGNEYESMLSEYYNFIEAKDFIVKNNVSALLPIPAQQHPLQALMAKEIECVLPILTSFEKPHDDRKVGKILLLAYNTYSSPYERDCVASLMRRNNIDVDMPDTESMDYDRFKEYYCSNEYDVIWISTHLEYDHYSPHLSTIKLSEKLEINLDEIALINLQIDGRRLLFLNACDGATALTTGGIHEIGFAASLASKHQIVISHLWPIHIIPAMIAGIIYSIGICKKMSFLESFKYTLIEMNKGKQSLTTELKKHVEDVGEALDRVENNGLDLGNIMYWGSLVYYQ